MKSRWFGIKEKACDLRREGISIRVIEQRLKIPRSTLSGWFRDIKLSKSQKRKLRNDWEKALIKARTRAVLWHNGQKDGRMKKAEVEANEVLARVDVHNSALLDVAFAMLYLGEGFKRSVETGIGNSDPMILNFFLAVLEKNYRLDVTKIRCELHLRADQDAETLKKYWAKALHLPLKSFKYVVKDKRTVGVPTYSRYKGVCLLRCGNVAIQRKLVYLSQKFCGKVIDELRA